MKSDPPVVNADDGAALPVIPLACLAVALLIELLLYYGDAPELHLRQRIETLNFLVAPDQLFLLWCGEKLANFSLFDRWPIALLTAVILVAAWLAGRLLLVAFGVMRLLDRLEQTAFAVGMGLNLLSLYALAVGLAGGLQQRWVFVAAIVGLVVVNAVISRTGKMPVPPASDSLAHESGFDAGNDPRWYWWLLVAAPYALVMILGAMLPPWDYDVREYHLQAPKEWFQNGRIDFLPHNIYANMPLGSELTSVWAMALVGGKDGWWWGALAGKTVMACYSLVTAAALVAFGRRLHSLAAGVVAAVIYLATPWTVALATAGYNEGPVGMHALLAIFALVLARLPDNSHDVMRLTALAGFSAGSAVACKYPPILFLVIPLTVWVVGLGPLARGLVPPAPRAATANPPPGWPIRRYMLLVAVFFLATSAACGLWLAKNAVQANNPTYPLLYSAFDGVTRTPEKDAQWKRVHSPQPDSSGRRFSVNDFLSQLAWNGWRTLWASLTIPPLLAMALLDRRRWRFVAEMAAWMLYVLLAWWISTHRLDRFLTLLLPMAAIVAGLGAVAMPHWSWRAGTLGFIVCAAIAQFPFVTLHPDNRYFAPLAKLRRDDRELGVLQGHRVDTGKQWLNEHAQAGEGVLLLGDAEPFDLELPVVYNTCFDDCQFTRIFKGRTREERLAALREEKIVYVFCSWAHLARYRSPGNYGYTSDYPTRELVHAELVGEQGLLTSIKIETDPEKAELFRVAER